MAERIVSPGVFTREKDLSFLPQGIAEIGAAIVGPTKKGPAFVPTIVRNFNEFAEMFGGLDQDLYVPFTVREYLRSAGSVTIVRVLGIGGYSANMLSIGALVSSSVDARQIAVLAPSNLNADADLIGTSITGSVSSFTIGTGSFAFTASLDSTSANYIGDVFSSNPLSTKAQGQDTPFYIYKLFKPVTAMAGAVNVTGSLNSVNLKKLTRHSYQDH